jgi:hypothetical protein
MRLVDEVPFARLERLHHGKKPGRRRRGCLADGKQGSGCRLACLALALLGVGQPVGGCGYVRWQLRRDSCLVFGKEPVRFLPGDETIR